MYKKVSEKFKQMMEQQGGRTFKIKLESSSFVIDSGIKKIVYTGGSSAGDSITVGSAVSNYIEVVMEKVLHLITGQQISFDLGLEVNGAIEYMPMGIFKANKPEMTDYEITFKAYDRMMQAEKNYVSDLKYPTDTVKVMQEIEKKLGIEFITNISPITLNNPSTEEGGSNIVFTGYSIREAIGYIAGLYGKFAIFNRLGQLEFKWYEENGFEIPVSKCYSFTKNESNYTINKVIGTAADDTKYEAGSGITGISFSNPFVTQDIVDRIHAEIGGFTYRGGETKFLGDCRIDVWDIVTGEDLFGNVYKLPVMEIVHEIDGGLTTTVKSKVSDSENVEDTFKGPVVKAMERTHAQLLLVNNLIASKASIEYLEANYIKTDELDAVEANIENAVITNLQGKFASIEYLEANYAAIDFANVQKASIGTMLADVGLISSATIVDGHVTGFLDAVKVNASNITAGVLDAGNIEVVNLKAANITVGQINGYQIAPGAIDMNNLAESITNEISSASSNAQTALDEALKAFNEAESAALAAGTAQATADGKNTVFYQVAAPSGTHKLNDVWFDTDDSNKMYYWNGSAWAARQFGTNAIANASITNALIANATIQSAKIASLDAGKITTGTLNADRIGANTITTIKIAVGDFINYASWKDKTAATSPFTKRNSPWSIDTTVYRTSKASYKFTGTGEANMTEIVIPVNIGEEIYAEFWYKTDSGWTCNTSNSKLRFGSSGGGLLTQFAVSATAQTSWTKVSGTYKVTNSTGPYISVSFNMSGTAAGKSIWIDDITIKKRTTGELIVDGAITTNKLSANAVTADKISAGAITTAKIVAGAITSGTIAAGAITADKISAGAVTAAKLSVGNGGNLYATGYDTFENIPNVANQIYYQKSGTAAVSIDTSTAYYGTRCLKIVSTGTDSYVHLGSSTNGYGCIPVISGKTYIVSVWLKASAKTTAQLYVIGHTAKNNSNSQHTGTTATVENVWTRAYLRYTAISTYPYISIRVDNDTNGTTLWVDAIQVETGTQSQTPSEFSPAGTTVINGARIVTGSITANSIASSAITTDKLTANSITAAKIASGAITADKIAAGAVTAEKINVTSLEAIVAKIGGFTIDNNSIRNGTWGTSGSVMMCTGSSVSKSIAGSGSINGWCFTAGNKFGVTKTGDMYTSSIAITGGNIDLTSGETQPKINIRFSNRPATYTSISPRYTWLYHDADNYMRLSGYAGGAITMVEGGTETVKIIGVGGSAKFSGGVTAATVTSTGKIKCTGEMEIGASGNASNLILNNGYERRAYVRADADRIWLLPATSSGFDPGHSASLVLATGIFYAAGWGSNSSKRYKENIKPIEESVANRLMDMEIYSFDYKPKYGDKGMYGVIAEEIKTIHPTAVFCNDKGLPDSVDYTRFIPLLIKKAQMQEKQIKYLKNIIDSLMQERGKK
ncbi:tail fiber domain-containing protein [Lachnospiraceae bacterium 48-33]